MARPVPHWRYLTELACWVQANLGKTMDWPVLLGAVEGGPHALVAGREDRQIHVLDVKKRKVVRKLEIGRASRRATDFHTFAFNEGSMAVCGYDSYTHRFFGWSLADGKMFHESEGDGLINPAMCFLTGGRLCVCDGPRISTYNDSGELVCYTPVSDDLRSIVLFPKPATRPTVVAVGVFRKGLGGHHVHSLVIENGLILGRQEGPYRNRPEDPDDNKSITLHELINIPGSTQRVLILAEEEMIERKAKNTDWEFDQSFVTRLVPLNPQDGTFLGDELEITGRHCLEMGAKDLLLLDEWGRKRRVTPFPLRVKVADWRLEEAAS